MEHQRSAIWFEILGFAAVTLWLLHCVSWVFVLLPIRAGPVDLSDWIGWCAAAGAVALGLVATSMIVARRRGVARNSDLLLAWFLSIQVALEVFVTVSMNVLPFYAGVTRAVLVTRWSLVLLLALATIYGLFRGRAWLRWIAPTTTLVWLISVSWILEPNSSTYLPLQSEIERAFRAQGAQSDAVTATILEYPAPAHYALYVGLAIYSWLRPSSARDADA